MQTDLLKIKFFDYICRIKDAVEEDELGEIMHNVATFIEFLIEFLEEKEEDNKNG